MTRDDWAQHGTAMTAQSAAIREWLGVKPYVFFTPNMKSFAGSNSADREFVEFVAPDSGTRHVFDLSELVRMKRGDPMHHAVTVIHPFEDRDCELIRDVIEAGTIERIFVIVWAPSDRVKVMLDAFGATDLHSGETAPAPSALHVEAARLIVDEQYNGLTSGKGKDAVIQLLREFRAEGDPLNERTWLYALYSVGASFSSGETVAKFLKEMKAGTNHRVKQRFVPGIVDLLRRDLSVPPERR